MEKLLLLSNSTMPGTPFFTWPRPWVKNFLDEKAKTVAFIPFAAVTLSFNEYEGYVKQAFADMGYAVQSVHQAPDALQLITKADAIVVGGGNTFALLARMYNTGLLDAVRQKVLAGTPYIGWSAGANLACPTIMTTNDMPVIQPPSFQALNLVPFQINPHYHELKFEGQGGETRKERLAEFVALNPTRRVIGLPEGMLLRKENGSLKLEGQGTAKLYAHNKPIQDLPAGTDMLEMIA